MQDLYHNELLPELRVLVRAQLTAQERLRNKRVCREWLKEDSAFGLSTLDAERIYKHIYTHPAEGEARRRLFLEWVANDGPRWKYTTRCEECSTRQMTLEFKWHLFCSRRFVHVARMMAILGLRKPLVELADKEWSYTAQFPGLNRGTYHDKVSIIYGLSPTQWRFEVLLETFPECSCSFVQTWRPLMEELKDTGELTLSALLARLPADLLCHPKRYMQSLNNRDK